MARKPYHRNFNITVTFADVNEEEAMEAFVSAVKVILFKDENNEVSN